MLFSPLSRIQVLRTRVEGSLIIIEVRSANLISSTIEQVLTKRRKLLKQLKGDIITELSAASSDIASMKASMTTSISLVKSKISLKEQGI